MLKIRNIHELSDMKRPQDLRVDELSVQTLRESHTIQRLTSQLQSMQEQMSSMNDSRGKFQEVESNHSGRLSHVPSQPEVIPSSSSMLSRDKNLPFDTWNAPGLQENVSGNQSSTFGLHQNPSQGMSHKERQNQFHEQ